MACKTNIFTKEVYEAFMIKADFSNNFETGETISTHTVTAVDKDGTEVTSTVIGATAIVGDDQVSAMVQNGTAEASYYTITFRCTTSTGSAWQLDVSMGIL